MVNKSMHKYQHGIGLCLLLLAVIAGCKPEDSPPVSLRSDFVPLKVVMTDYIIDEGKLFKIDGSAQLIVPLSGYEPEPRGKCFVYSALPRPTVDPNSVIFEKLKVIKNERGLLTSRAADSKRINELRAKAKKEMIEIAGSEANVRQAMSITASALRQFYEKFDGYSCTIQWK